MPIKFDWKHLFGTLGLFIGIASCSSEDPDIVDEPELIITMNVTFTNTMDTSNVVIAVFRDLDGEGGIDGTIQNPTLNANASYTVAVEFLNESVTPTDNITAEVREEDDEHQVFFLSSSALNLTMLTQTQTVMATHWGWQVPRLQGRPVLVHEPTKTAQGVSAGDITNAGGEEDIRVIFDVTIQ